MILAETPQLRVARSEAASCPARRATAAFALGLALALGQGGLGLAQTVPAVPAPSFADLAEQ